MDMLFRQEGFLILKFMMFNFKAIIYLHKICNKAPMNKIKTIKTLNCTYVSRKTRQFVSKTDVASKEMFAMLFANLMQFKHCSLASP